MPFFSVIICTYNRERLIPRALKSLINQKFGDFEIIIIDDGSQDNTESVCRSVLSQSVISGYTYHYQQNAGLSKARNKGIELSSGRYITFLDSDDEYLDYHLESRYKILNEMSSIDLLHGGLEIIGNPYVPDKNDLSRKIHLKDCFVGGSMFVKRESALMLGGFDSVSYSEDSAFYEKAIKHRLRIEKTSIPSYKYYRDTEDSICNKFDSIND